VNKESGYQALKSGNNSRAISDFEKAILYLPDDAELHYFLGQVFRELQFDDGAEINQLNYEMGQKASDQFRQRLKLMVIKRALSALSI